VALWVLVGLVVVAVLLRTHRLSAMQVVLFCVLVPSIVLHEVSHGVVALAFGDDTAKRAGRLTLNPLRHLDPLGSVILPALLVIAGVGAFGWAKPVPVNLSRLRSPRNQGVLVALAGPATNALVALAAGLGYAVAASPATKVLFATTGSIGALPLGVQALFLAGYANVLLGVFNLLPIPPLDGSAVLERLLPRRLWVPYLRIRPFMLVVPLALVLLDPGLVDRVFEPALRLWGRLLG
jgi:Zn-dependent protease